MKRVGISQNGPRKYANACKVIEKYAQVRQERPDYGFADIDAEIWIAYSYYIIS